MSNEEKNLIEKNDSLKGEDVKHIQDIAIEYEEQYEGFVPHPSILEGLKRSDPTFPERVVSMAESLSNAEIRKIDAEIRKMDAETRKIDADSKLEGKVVAQEGLGLIFIFTLALILIGASILLVFKGHEMLAIVPFFGGMAPIITAAIQNLRKPSGDPKESKQ